MIFKDEKEMWYADTEILAAKLANKDVKEIQEILDDHDVIKLQSTDREKKTVFNRLATFIVYPILLVLFCVKWLMTGRGHLDSWDKKYKSVSFLMKMIGEK